MVIAYLIYWQILIVNENYNWKKIKRCKFVVLIKDDLYQEFDLINTYKY